MSDFIHKEYIKTRRRVEKLSKKNNMAVVTFCVKHFKDGYVLQKIKDGRISMRKHAEVVVILDEMEE